MEHEAISIWLNEDKLSGKFDKRVKSLIHSPGAQTWWQKHGQTTTTKQGLIDWKALGLHIKMLHFLCMWEW